MPTVNVILKDKIANLGAEADVVSVKTGYARNYLVPQGKALEANSKNVRELDSLKAIRAQREAKELNDAEKAASKIKKLKLTLELATGQGGKAFGSITTKTIADAVKEKTGLDLDRHQLNLDKPIKSTGRYDIPVNLHPDVQVELRLNVAAEKSDSDEDSSSDD
ncbi:50S ribosomal protein L9 [soil metagenome]